MSVERYKIVRKLEEGGSGSVYVAYDTRLNREVAIKRINSQMNDWSDGSIETVLQEARALSALQHPNIVTIYDADIDSDGPFVVMELLSGQNIDDLISENSLVVEDFLEFANQCLEGLIAAHNIPLIHRDIKPNNIVLKWLPSGKFQAKLLDFGMAKLAHQPTKQTVDQNDSVFGSIYFMAPEQFERTELDARTDLYALGSVFYYTLAGTYPFTGDTAAAVMVSHLQHHVTHLSEKRPDIPQWIGDWVMWLLSRDIKDRPKSAQEALEVLTHQSADIPRRQSAQVQLPVAQAAPSNSPVRVAQTATEIPAMPSSSSPSLTKVETPAAPRLVASPAAPVTKVSARTPVTPKIKTTQTPFSAPSGMKQSQLSNLRQTTTHVGVHKQTGAVHVEKSTKNAALNAILAVVAVLFLIAGGLLMYRISANSKVKEINRLLSQSSGTNEGVATSSEEIDTLLNQLYTVSGKLNNELIYRRLAIAESFDGTDIDVKIAEFATSPSNLIDEIRVALFKVLGFRKGESSLPILLDYAAVPETKNELVIAAVTATRSTAKAEDLSFFIKFLLEHKNTEVKKSAEKTANTIIENAEDKEFVAKELKAALYDAKTPVAKSSVIRLLGTLGGEDAKNIINQSIARGGEDHKSILPAIRAIKNWPDASMTESIIDIWSTTTDPIIRKQSYDTAIFLLSKYYRKDRSGDQLWSRVANGTDDSREKMKFLGSAIALPKPVAVSLIKSFETDPDALIAKRAKNALGRLQNVKAE